MNKNQSALNRYMGLIKFFCKVKDIRDDVDGCFGVAMVLSYIEGVEPTLYTLSNHLDIDIRYLKNAYGRLKMNGIFNDAFSARSDKVLQGENKISSLDYMNDKHYTEVSWGIIAGVASGLTGVGS